VSLAELLKLESQGRALAWRTHAGAFQYIEGNCACLIKVAPVDVVSV
jgi:hypothetical protein